VTEQRYKAVLAVIGDGRTVSEVATDWGVSRRTMHRWLVRYEGDGLEGLNNRSHRPAQSPHQMPPAVEAMVLEMRRTHGERAESPLNSASGLSGHPQNRRSTAAWSVLRSSTLSVDSGAGKAGNAGSTRESTLDSFGCEFLMCQELYGEQSRDHGLRRDCACLIP